LWDTATGKDRLKLQGEFAEGGGGLAFSPDGKTLATNTDGMFGTSQETTIALWDAKTGTFQSRLRLPMRHVKCIRFSPDGRTLLTTGDEPRVGLWDARTGKPVLPTWPAHTDAVASLAFTPDGRSLVSGGNDGTARLWEVSGGRLVRELAGHGWGCRIVAVTPDGKTILSSGTDGGIRVHDRAGNQLRRFPRAGEPAKRNQGEPYVCALAVTPDSKTAVTWSVSMHEGGSRGYDLWDLATGKALSNCPDSTPNHITIRRAFSPDANLVAENLYGPPQGGPGSDSPYGGGPTRVGVMLREVATGREVLRLKINDPQGGLDIDAFAPDGRALLTVTNQGGQTDEGYRYTNVLQFWELVSGKERLRFSRSSLNYRIEHVAFAPDGRTLATARGDNTIQFWDLRTGKERSRELVYDAEVQCLVFSPDSRRLASGHRDGSILVWDAAFAEDPKERPESKLNGPQLERHWADLAGADATRAYRAIGELSMNPAEAIRLFRERLRPFTEGPADKLRALIAELESPEYQRRVAADEQLTAFDEQSLPALRAALRAEPSLEQRKRIEKILEALRVVRSPEILRYLRAVEVLERIGGPDACEVLEKLTTGVPDARLTRAAQASLRRLGQRP
jgi:WD40 repeat protein